MNYAYGTKRPSLKLKTMPGQLLGHHPLDIAIPDEICLVPFNDLLFPHIYCDLIWISYTLTLIGECES